MNHPFDPAAPSPDRLRAQQRQLERVAADGAHPEQICDVCHKPTRHGTNATHVWIELFLCEECLKARPQ